ncbi:hypothetical protein AB3R30_25185 [Leptolyngbyaceae cyanobacterium UHCC 1019]
MTALATREAPALTEYKAQGLGHILKLSAITTAGMVLVSIGGNALFAAPLAAATIYGMFRSTGKVKDADWCHSRDELWHYKLSRKHKSIADSYSDWCKEWGKGTINSLIEPMIGNCELCNFTKDKKHPYYGLRGILTFDDGESVPLTPADYVAFRLWERQEALSRKDAIEAEVLPVDQKLLPESTDPLADTFGDSQPVAAPPNALEFLRSLTSAPLQPVIIAGLPGSGKGVMAALALSLGVKERGLRYWIFNPKNKLSEAGYWARAEKHYLKDRLMNDDGLFSDLMATLEEFASEGSRRNNQPGKYEPFILLLEEITSLIGLFTPKQKQIFKAKMTGIASLARGCNMAIWMSGQSVTLEDLGFTGKSNRAMFTAIAAVGPDRAGSKSICDLLSIPFDEPTLPAGRVWLTSNAVYGALTAPSAIPQYATWQEVPNLIDLRPGAATPQATSHTSADIDNLLSSPALTPKKIEQIANAYGLPLPKMAEESTAIAEVPITQNIDFDLDDVLPELRPIVEYSIKQNGFIKAIDVKRNVAQFKSVSTEEIRNHFIGLVNVGCGVSQGDGDLLKYSAFGGVMGCDGITG